MKFVRGTPIADKRKLALKEYDEKSKKYLQDHPECNIKSPNCTFHASCINHTKGKDSLKQLLKVKDWESSCWPCNLYIEENHAWAAERGHKKRRHGKYKRTK